MQLRRLVAADVPGVVQLWHATKRATYEFLASERGRTLADDDTFFRAHILERCAIWIAVADGAPLGFLALTGSYLDPLYVAPAAQRRGIGAALFAKARELSPTGLELHTHVKNHAARAFYEQQGCTPSASAPAPPPSSNLMSSVECHWRPAQRSRL
ncbi:MAG: GNAT family N-acetyltransferase [Myxococcales bacterium]|nr:GNAT family N-acetyltransferase [Myxococcales bacterium]